MSNRHHAAAATQASQHQPHGNSQRIDYDLEESLIRKKAEECVQYILFCCLADRKTIVRRADLNKHVLKDYSKSFRAVLELTERYMRDVFGLLLVDLDAEAGGRGGDKYGVRSKFEFDADLAANSRRSLMTATSAASSSSSSSSSSGTAAASQSTQAATRDTQQADPSQMSASAAVSVDTSTSEREFQDQLKYSMVLVSLALIFMNENEMEANTFWDSLKKLDINRDEKRHKYLGDVQRFFTVELVKDGFLEYEQVRNVEPPSFRFKWGYRARLEITKRSVLDFVCQVYGGTDVCKPQEWIAQFADAAKSEGGGDSGAAGGDGEVEPMEADEPAVVRRR